jgi:hypothetical protein
MKQRKFRMEEDLYQSIPGPNKSGWVREAISQRLQGEKGLTSDYTKEIKEIKKELRAIGININQLAKKANQGLPVVLSEAEKIKLLEQIVLADKHTLKILRLLNV